MLYRHRACDEGDLLKANNTQPKELVPARWIASWLVSRTFDVRGSQNRVRCNEPLSRDLTRTKKQVMAKTFKYN